MVANRPLRRILVCSASLAIAAVIAAVSVSIGVGTAARGTTGLRARFSGSDLVYTLPRSAQSSEGLFRWHESRWVRVASRVLPGSRGAHRVPIRSLFGRARELSGSYLVRVRSGPDAVLLRFQVPRALTLGYVNAPNQPFGQTLARFAAEISASSRGALKIRLIAGYGGGGDMALLADERDGVVDMGSVSTLVWPVVGVTTFQALQLPFLITNYALEQKVLDSRIEARMLGGTGRVGVHGLAIIEGGLREPLSRGACITTAPGFQGLKMRAAASPLLFDSLKALGASPIPLPASDVYLALKSGLIDGAETSVNLAVTNRYSEVAKCMTDNAKLWPFPSVVTMNNAAWSRLMRQDRNWISVAASRLADTSIGIVSSTTPQLVNDLCESGLKFGSATPSALAAMRAQVNSVYAKYTSMQPTGTLVAAIEEIKASTPDPPAAPLPPGCAAP
jgi:TRAP-type C4-dicarboxylate transport system substrate-binding protein